VSLLQEYARLQAEKQSGRVVIPLVKEYLLGQWQTSDREVRCVHPSEMCKKDWCERATYLRIVTGYVPPEPFNFNLQSIFDEGHQIHDKWQMWLRGTGRLWGTWRCLVCDSTVTTTASRLPHEQPHEQPHVWKYEEVTLSDGIIQGHEDAAIDDRLVEFKSVGLGTLRHDSPDLLARFYLKDAKVYDLDGLWKALSVPLKSHVRQANVYLYLARQMGLDFPRCSIVYEYKPNQQSREFVVPLSEDIMAPMLAKVDSIKSALETALPPRCPYGGCRQCQSYENHHISQLPDGGGVSGGAGAGDRPADAGAAQAADSDADPAQRRDGAARQCPDGAVPQADGLAEVHGDPARARRSGRKVLYQEADAHREKL
jgi:hypothetical protein